MRIWCIKIGIVLVLHFNPWVEASAGGLLVPEGLYSPVAKHFGVWFKIRIWIKNCKEKSKSYKFISKRRIISLMHSSILRWFWLNFMALWFLIDYLKLYVPLKNFALLCIWFFRLFYLNHIFFSDFQLFGLSTTDETSLVEMRMWCIKIGIVLVLHHSIWSL